MSFPMRLYAGTFLDKEELIPWLKVFANFVLFFVEHSARVKELSQPDFTPEKLRLWIPPTDSKEDVPVGFVELVKEILTIVFKSSASITDFAMTGSHATLTIAVAEMRHLNWKNSPEGVDKRIPQIGLRPAMPAIMYAIHKCNTCGDSAKKKCGGCKLAYYCSKKCLNADWTAHKPSCSVSLPYRCQCGQATRLMCACKKFAHCSSACQLSNTSHAAVCEVIGQTG